jgi:hypothetical protein
MKRWWSSTLLVTALATSLVVQAGETPLIADTPGAACQVLKNRIARMMRLPGGKPDPSWFCDEVAGENALLYIFQLRSNPPGNPSRLGTVPLIGTFAVARRGTVVLQIDVAEDRLIPIFSAYPQSR